MWSQFIKSQILSILLVSLVFLPLTACSKSKKKVTKEDRPPVNIRGSDPVKSEFISVSGSITKVKRE